MTSALGASLGTRLATLAKSRSMLSYDEGRELIAELDGLRTTIVETIGPQELCRSSARQSKTVAQPACLLAACEAARQCSQFGEIPPVL